MQMVYCQILKERTFHNRQNKRFLKLQIRSDDMDIKYTFEKRDWFTSDSKFKIGY